MAQRWGCEWREYGVQRGEVNAGGRRIELRGCDGGVGLGWDTAGVWGLEGDAVPRVVVALRV